MNAESGEQQSVRGCGRALALLVDGERVRLAVVGAARPGRGHEVPGGLQDFRGLLVAADRDDGLGARVAADGDVVQDQEHRLALATRTGHRVRGAVVR
ncbi:hypothetical protein [Streptomyces sp. NPDC014894]|uniref:hypothetical protein n=1 Tax=Streptomyces sp. NPDC014894 TaxID=3364931 RepID=UPI0036FE7D24